MSDTIKKGIQSFSVFCVVVVALLGGSLLIRLLWWKCNLDQILLVDFSHDVARQLVHHLEDEQRVSLHNLIIAMPAKP